uniref:Uncharacterized protein n=1 Tax=Anopheles culicifacies TaxID=139723 RepID=A0A182MVM9_9DIPT
MIATGHKPDTVGTLIGVERSTSSGRNDATCMLEAISNMARVRKIRKASENLKYTSDSSEAENLERPQLLPDRSYHVTSLVTNCMTIKLFIPTGQPKCHEDYEQIQKRPNVQEYLVR